MKLVGTNENMLCPETTAEAGLLAWLANRFEGKTVTLVFDTTYHAGVNHHPMLWIREVSEEDSAK